MGFEAVVVWILAVQASMRIASPLPVAELSQHVGRGGGGGGAQTEI